MKPYGVVSVQRPGIPFAEIENYPSWIHKITGVQLPEQVLLVLFLFFQLIRTSLPLAYDLRYQQYAVMIQTK